MSSKLHILDLVVLALLCIGGLNWGLLGIANFNLVSTLCGPYEALARVIYTIVGLAGVYLIVRAPTFLHETPHVRPA
ncbi:MAG: DUF378 domain-containing protein [Phycisphaerae bacterium]|jgi:hypothetical protein